MVGDTFLGIRGLPTFKDASPAMYHHHHPHAPLKNFWHMIFIQYSEGLQANKTSDKI